MYDLVTSWVGPVHSQAQEFWDAAAVRRVGSRVSPSPSDDSGNAVVCLTLSLSVIKELYRFDRFTRLLSSILEVIYSVPAVCWVQQ